MNKKKMKKKQRRGKETTEPSPKSRLNRVLMTIAKQIMPAADNRLKVEVLELHRHNTPEKM